MTKTRPPAYPVPERVIHRLLSKTERVDGCLLSLYSRGSHGYSQIGWKEKAYEAAAMVLGHRAVWSHHNGPIPTGMTIDHTCRNRGCIELDHLRLITNVDNATDNGQDNRYPPVESDRLCRKGHKLMLYASGAYACRECARIAGRKKDAKRRERGTHR